jgi:hypothetical protein
MPRHKERSAFGPEGRKMSAGTDLAQKLERVGVSKKKVVKMETTDEVFESEPDDTGNPSKRPSGDLGKVPQESAPEFPSVYGIIRANKFKKLGAGSFGNFLGWNRVGPRARAGYGSGGLSVPGDTRPFSVQNYHCAEKGLNMSLTLKKPAAGAADELQCVACPNAHGFAGRVAGGSPIVFILSDQNFPAMLPASGGNCAVIFRVEDGLLSDLEGVFLDRVRALLRPHGSLPAGSLVLVGSLSHLRARGLADYAECLVKTIATLIGLAGNGTDVMPLVTIPSHSVDSPAQVRSMMDLDGWILESNSNNSGTLPKTRRVFWDVVTRGCHQINYQQDSFTMMMPIGLRNHRKRPMTSDPFSGPIPATISSFSESEEKEVVSCMLQEINETNGLKLDPDPNFDRGTEPITANGKNRTVILGASHMHRVAAVVAAGSGQVLDLTAPGWTPSKESFMVAANCVAELSPDCGDLVILDIWSNSAFLGTDELGLPLRAVRDSSDGRYHVLGPLQAAPRTVFQKILDDARPVLDAAGEARIILVAPFPRYISGKCCADPSHITNFGADGYRYEFEGLRDRVESVLAESGVGGGGIGLFHLSDAWQNADWSYSDLRTDSGGPVWRQDDPVHLTADAYHEVASALLLLRGGDCEPLAKRRRLESVVTGQRGLTTRGKAIRPMPWVAGLETGNGGRGRGWAAAVGGGRGRGSSQSPWFASGQRGSIWRSGRGRAFRTRGGRRGRY